MKDDYVYFYHILDAIIDIEQSIKACSKLEFMDNKDMRDANVRRIGIIGEAAKNISSFTKQKYGDVNWKEIIGTRDKMIHHYLLQIPHRLRWLGFCNCQEQTCS